MWCPMGDGRVCRSLASFVRESLVIWGAAVALSCDDAGTGPSGARVASVEITSSLGSVAVGQSLQLLAVAKDSSSTAITAAAITWSVSPTTVANISATGLVRGLSVGSATITASAGGTTSTFQLAVRDTASLPRELSGRIERVNVTLTGDYRVTGDLIVFADSALRVNGRIVLASGTKLALVSDKLLDLSGSIERDTLTSYALGRSAASPPSAAENSGNSFLDVTVTLLAGNVIRINQGIIA